MTPAPGSVAMKKRRTETKKYELISLATNRLLQDSGETVGQLIAQDGSKAAAFR